MRNPSPARPVDDVKLAVSNIAWKPEEKEAAYALLQELGVRGLEVAPGLLFDQECDPFDPTERTLVSAVDEVLSAGLKLVSMQSLLFGIDDAMLFGSDTQRRRFSRRLDQAIDLAGRLGIPNLVIGSPTNRSIPNSLDRQDAWSLAADTFRKLGDHARACGCKLAMEPNPSPYGTNFLTSTAEAYAFVRMTDNPAVTINLDIGALHLNGEFAAIESVFPEVSSHVSHIHISEAYLAPVPEDPATLHRLFAVLSASQWKSWVSVEMRAGPDRRLERVRHAIESCREAIGD